MNSKRVISKFISEIVFASIKIVITPELSRDFVSKSVTNVRQIKLTVVSLAKRTFKFLKITS